MLFVALLDYIGIVYDQPFLPYEEEQLNYVTNFGQGYNLKEYVQNKLGHIQHQCDIMREVKS